MKSIADLYKLYTEHPVVSTDSRSIPPDSIFFALRGDNFDGNSFALEAIRSGARLAVVDNSSITDSKCILVPNVLETLQQLANYHRKRLGVRILGLTGTNGKTTTKELASAVLSRKFRTLATRGNLNNHIGVPLTLLSITNDIELAVIEMGANHPGEIARLASIAEPDYGIITNIGKAHLEGFGSFEGVVQTKGELYEFLGRSNGMVFYNRQNETLCGLIGKYKLEASSIPYQRCWKDIIIRSSPSTPYLSVRLTTLADNKLDINTSLIGSYNFENVMAAIAVGVHFGVPVAAIKDAIEGYTPSNNRSQFLKTPSNELILDAYNANPSSMELAIRNFAGIEHPNKTAIIGEMLELGEYSRAEHQRIVQLMLSLKIGNVLLVGKGFEGVTQGLLHFPDSESCSLYLKQHKITNHLILVKGSRGVKLERVVSEL